MLDIEKEYDQYNENVKLFYLKKSKMDKYNEKLFKLKKEKQDYEKRLEKLRGDINYKSSEKYDEAYNEYLKSKENEIIYNYDEKIRNIKEDINQFEQKIHISKRIDKEYDKEVNDILYEIDKNYNRIEKNIDNLRNLLPDWLIKSITDNNLLNTVDDLKKVSKLLPKPFNKENLLKNQSGKLLKLITAIGSGVIGILLGSLVLPFFVPINILGKIIFAIIYYFLLYVFGGSLYSIISNYVFSRISLILLFLFSGIGIFLFKNHIYALAHLIKNSEFYYLYLNIDKLSNEFLSNDEQLNQKRLSEFEEKLDSLYIQLENLQKDKYLAVDGLFGQSYEELPNEIINEIKASIKEKQLKEETSIVNKIEELSNNEEKLLKQIEKIDIEEQQNKCLEILENLNGSIVTLNETKGCLSEKVYVLSKQNEDKLVNISTIEHNLKPTVLLYNIDESVSNVLNVTSQLQPFILNIIEGMFRLNAFSSFEQYIVDTVSGCKELQMPKYKNIVTVCEKTSQLNELINKIESSIDKVILTGKGSIQEANIEKFENGDPTFKYQIVYFIIPPIESSSNSNIINQDLWRLMQTGDKYGFIPFFIIKESEWDTYLAKGNSTNSYFNQLNKIVDKSNIYKIDLEKQICEIREKVEEVCYV